MDAGIHTVRAVNQLLEDQKRAIYTRMIPEVLKSRFHFGDDWRDEHGNDLLKLNAPAESSVAEMALYHQTGFPDPLLYGQITDTLNGQIHVLLYVLNDPSSPRFDIDRLPDGSLTHFGAEGRNLKAEIAALNFGLSPGQIRSGLGLMRAAMEAFEKFIASLDHDLYFAEPLHYHTAIIFERYGFAYEKGRILMQSIHQEFQPGGDLAIRLDGSNPFRSPDAANSIRLRSWALHDNLRNEPFTDVSMYKSISKPAQINTAPGCEW